MSRLRVGDIVIEGSSVSIGGKNAFAPSPANSPQQPSSSPHQATHLSPHREPFLHGLSRIPFASRLWVAAGSMTALVGVVLSVLLQAWSNPLGAVLNGAFLVPVGVGLIAVGATKHFIATRPALLHRAVLGDPEPYRARLASLLARPRGEQTVEWIGQRTGWGEHEVVHALALLRQRGEIQEELDFDTGEFYYVYVSPSLPPRDLDTRLGDLTP